MPSSVPLLTTATHWGIVHPVVKNGLLVGLTPFSGDQYPSPNLDRIVSHVNHPNRIDQPYIREGYLKGTKSTERGRDRYVPVSWDIALNTVAQTLAQTYDNHGPSAVYGRSYGWKSPGSVHNPITLTRRLLRLMGGYIQTKNSYSTGCINSIMPFVIGGSEPAVPVWDEVIKHCECIVFWGADPIVTNDIDWFTTLHEGNAALLSLKAKGTPTITINPLRTETGKLLDSTWHAIRPGTDVALMYAIIHTLASKQLLDLQEIHRVSDGFEVILDEAFGHHDGIVRDAQWASTITGLDAQTIEQLAITLKTKRSMIMMGWGAQRARFGEMPPWMVMALGVALGHMSKAGCGIGYRYHYSDGGVAAGIGPTLGAISEHVNAVRVHAPTTLLDAVPVARVTDLLSNPGKTITYQGKEITYPDVKMVLWAGGNPLAHQPDSFAFARALQRLETVVVTDTVWSPIAQHADIVLPATTTFERDDITPIGTYSNRGIVAMQQAIAPRAQARNDFDILSDLANRLGIESAFTENRTAQQWIEWLYQDAVNRAQTMGVELPDFENFWHQGVHLFEVPETARQLNPWQAYIQDPSAHPLRTPSGKIQLFSPVIAEMKDKACPPYPRFMPNDLPKAESCDFQLMSVKSTKRLHSQLGVNDTEIEPVWMHPNDIAEKQLSEGEIVEVSNELGTVLARLVASNDVLSGCVVLTHGAWFKPTHDEAIPSLSTQASSNVLIPDIGASTISWGNIASGAWVKVRPH